ncbi:U32 family peptidase [Candidatus Magnetobacterium bavaricum]|uniref:U32 family peptidase n=1 Tax=Candidatus Magnetobacterium bavaricum TaxID=29290 RepID=A0A0F3H0N8_9BACT|nr:U32 family peptidase [Candidatus Magnetobacterium bavaricum]
MTGFSLRAKGDNFDGDQLKSAVDYAHAHGKKAYVTVNVFLHNRDLHPLAHHIEHIRGINPDGVIVSDPGAFDAVSEAVPELPIHISTQANITNWRSARFYERIGAKRLVLARELSIDEIRDIRNHVSIELECFVHGAICISYSGRCYISAFLTNRSANSGLCTNSCRWSYTLMEEKRPGEHFPVYEDDRGTYVMSSRDLCMVEHLDKLYAAGVDSFKLEGRVKGVNYLASVVKVYREAIDTLVSGRDYVVDNRWLEELSSVSNRGFTTGMYLGRHPHAHYNHDEQEMYKGMHNILGVVRSTRDGWAEVYLKGKLTVGDSVVFLSPALQGSAITLRQMNDVFGNPIDSAKNEDTVVIPVVEGVSKNDLLRKK